MSISVRFGKRIIYVHFRRLAILESVSKIQGNSLYPYIIRDFTHRSWWNPFRSYQQGLISLSQIDGILRII